MQSMPKNSSSLAEQQSTTTKDFPTALKHYTETVNLRASGKEFNAVVYNNRACVHQAMWQYPLAVADSSRAIALNALNDRSWKAYHVRHMGWYMMGIFSLALQDLQMALQQGAPPHFYDDNLLPQLRCKKDKPKHSRVLGLSDDYACGKSHDAAMRVATAAWRNLIVQVHPDRLQVVDTANLLTRLLTKAKEALCC